MESRQMDLPSRAQSALCALGLLGLLVGSGYADPSGNSANTPARTLEPRALIELFTSQGCSSCQPADQMVSDLAEDRSVIAMSVPIDYWDYLGWKDTLASPRHTARQRGYAARRGDREVYTPQVVINGVAQALGSDRRAIEAGIALSHSRPGTLTLPVKIVVKDDKLEISVTPRDESGNEGEVWICALAKSVPVAIKRGENRGRTATYHNVARRWIRLGRWTGPAQTWTLARSEVEHDGIDSIVVLVQAGNVENPGPVFGATTLALR
jgi:hypothetical protein